MNLFQDHLELTVYKERLQGVAKHINEHVQAGGDLWIFGTGDPSIRERAAEYKRDNAIAIGLNGSVKIVSGLTYAFAIDLAALHYFNACSQQDHLIFLFPYNPQRLLPGEKVGQPLRITHRDHHYPKTFLDAARFGHLKICYFHFKPLANPAGGSFYVNSSARPEGFFTFRNAHRQYYSINGFARLNSRQKEIAASKMASVLHDCHSSLAENCLYGILAGRAILPLVQLLSSTKSECIRFAGFTCDSSDYLMTNLVVSYLLQKSGKEARFYPPGSKWPHSMTSEGFKPLPHSFSINGVKENKSRDLNILIPFFIKNACSWRPLPGQSSEESKKGHRGYYSWDREASGCLAGYHWPQLYPKRAYYDWNRWAKNIYCNEEERRRFRSGFQANESEPHRVDWQRLSNLDRTLRSIENLQSKTGHVLKIWLIEASADGESQIPKRILKGCPKALHQHSIFKADENVAFSKQFLFLLGLELIKRKSGGDAMAIMHDSDVPIWDPQFPNRVYVGLQEKRILHNVSKGIYLSSRLHESLFSRFDERLPEFPFDILSDLRDGLLSGNLSNEVSRYLSTVWNQFEKALAKAREREKEVHSLSDVNQEDLVMSRLPSTDRKAAYYMRRIRKEYNGVSTINHYFPGFSWSGHVADLIKTLSISSVYTGWGFEDSMFMETAKRLWETPSQERTGVGSIVGPQGILEINGTVLGDAIHMYHDPSFPLPQKSRNMSTKAFHQAIFAFELKKAIQFDFIENRLVDSVSIEKACQQILNEICNPLLDTGLTTCRIPRMEPSEQLSNLFDYPRLGESDSIDAVKLLKYYSYWIKREQGWRIFEMPGRAGDVEGGLYRQDPRYRAWASENDICLPDIRLRIKLKKP